jgi:ribosome-associated toxin RatA of RatAB toxin-antitoxin module
VNSLLARWIAGRGAPLARAALAALLATAAAPALAQSTDGYAWRPEGTVEGCDVSTARVAGKDYLAARSVCVLPVSMEAVGAVIDDIESYPRWMGGSVKTKVLKVVDRERDAYVFWYRQHVTLFADRDVVLRSEAVVREEGRRVVRASSTSEVAYGPVEGHVRMPSFRSEWVLERLEDGRTRVSFMIDPDLAAGLPVAIANATIRTTPLRALQNLARVASVPRHAGRAPAAAVPPSRRS